MRTLPETLVSGPGDGGPGRDAAGAEPPVAMVLCAGLGTRLRPLTGQLPKPLVPIGGRPVLAHVAAQLQAAGVGRMVVNTHHRPERFEPSVLGGLEMAVQVVHEPEILGTAGGVGNAEQQLGPGDVLVWNGDILAEADLRALWVSHRQSGALATLAVHPSGSVEGTVGLDRAGRVARLRGERYGEEHQAVDFVGIQLLSAELRARLPRSGCLVGDLYQPALRAGDRIHTAAVVRRWRDVGSVAAYLEANLAWLAEQGRQSLVAPDAEIASGVLLDRALVGARSRVEGRGALERVVVWPDAVATAPLCDAIVMSSGEVVAV